VLHFIYSNAECCYAECHYAECRYAECRYAECRYAECRYAECRSADDHLPEKQKRKTPKYRLRFCAAIAHKTSPV
jgi:hypothetical protein